MRDVPKFYLRNFIDRDGLSNDYQQCTFSSQNFFGSYSFPILNLKRTWVSTKYEHVNEFYNSYFTEFDLKKDMVQIELNHKMKNNNHVKIAIAHGMADNFTFNNCEIKLKFNPITSVLLKLFFFTITSNSSGEINLSQS